MSKIKSSILFRTISLSLLLAFFADTVCYGLATLPASQNPIIKREILAALQRTQIRYAESEDAIRLLKANNAECLLLSSGKYLVAKGVAQDDLKLLRAIIHEDTEAIMQIIAKEDKYKYQGMKELILKYFSPSESNNLPIDLYVNHTVARAFEWLVLIEQGIIFRNEIPADANDFIKAIGPIVKANKHNYFTAEFWDSKIRGKRIKEALSDGARFYEVAAKFSNYLHSEILHMLTPGRPDSIWKLIHQYKGINAMEEDVEKTLDDLVMLGLVRKRGKGHNAAYKRIREFSEYEERVIFEVFEGGTFEDAIRDFDKARKRIKKILEPTIRSKDSIGKLIDKYSYGEEGQRDEARYDIITSGKSAVPLLISQLGASEPSYCYDRMQILVDIGDEALPDLLVALDNNDRNIRNYVLWAIDEMWSAAEKILPRLLKVIKEDPDRDIRIETINIVLEATGPSLDMILALKEDWSKNYFDSEIPEQFLKEASVEKDELAKQAAIFLENETDTKKMFYIIEFFTKQLSYYFPTQKLPQIPTLIIMLFNEDPAIRRKSVESLTLMATPEALEVLEVHLSYVSPRLLIPRYKDTGGERMSGHRVYRNVIDNSTGERFEYCDFPKSSIDFSKTIDKGKNPEYQYIVKTIRDIRRQISLKGKIKPSAGVIKSIGKGTIGGKTGKILSLQECIKIGKLRSEQRSQYGDKAMRLAAMFELGLPVPSGYVIRNNVTDEDLVSFVDEIVLSIEKEQNRELGNKDRPLQLAVRSSPSISMPGLLLTETNVASREKLLEAIKRVRASWKSPAPQKFRSVRKIPDRGGMTVIIQPMVCGYGNDNSASGVLFTRDVITGENKLTGKFAIKAKGEDIVTVNSTVRVQSMDDLKIIFPKVYEEFEKIKNALEKRFGKIQEVEFVIEDGKLWLLQTRDAEVSPQTQATAAEDMTRKDVITLSQMLNNIIEAKERQKTKHLYRLSRPISNEDKICQGTPLSSGATQGYVVFNIEEAEDLNAEGKPAILVVKEPAEIATDILSGYVKGIIIQYDGHIALHNSVLARSQGMPLISVSKDIDFKKGQIIIMDGTKGCVYSATSFDESLLKEDRIINIVGVDFNYAEEEEKVRDEYKGKSYWQLIMEHAILSKRIDDLREVTLKNLIDNLKAHIIHDLILETGKVNGKSEQTVYSESNMHVGIPLTRKEIADLLKGRANLPKKQVKYLKEERFFLKKAETTGRQADGVLAFLTAKASGIFDIDEEAGLTKKAEKRAKKEAHFSKLIKQASEKWGKRKSEVKKQYDDLKRLLGGCTKRDIDEKKRVLPLYAGIKPQTIGEIIPKINGSRAPPAQYRDIVVLPEGGKLYVIGDTHGDPESVKQILKDIDFVKRVKSREKIYMVFLGDYVNNGLDSISNLILILGLKQKYHNNVILLSGNHEFRETYMTALEECYDTHWKNAEKEKFPGKVPEDGTHYDHIRLELIRKFGFDKGEEIYALFAEWGRELPYICFSRNGLMMSHTIGLPNNFSGNPSLGALAGAKEDEDDKKLFDELGYEAWKATAKEEKGTKTTLHAKMVNSRDITSELLEKFKQSIGVKNFIVGHTHYRSGDVDHNGDLVTICSSDKNSSTAGQYIQQEMVVESRKKSNKVDKKKSKGIYEKGARYNENEQGMKRPGEAKPCYLEINIGLATIDLLGSRRLIAIRKNLYRGQIDELKETHPALDIAANEGRIFAITLGQKDKLQQMSNEELADLLISNLIHLRSPPMTRQKLIGYLQDVSFREKLLKGFTLMRDSIKDKPLPQDKPIRLCIVIEDKNLPTIVFKDPYNNLIAYSGKGKKTSTPYTSIYAGYNSLEVALKTNQEDGFNKIINHEADDIAIGYHLDEKIAEAAVLYDNVLDLYDAQSATVLLTDLLHAQLQEERIYEIKYDTSRLTASQIEIIEEYVRLLQLRSLNPDSIKLRPFSSAQGSKESLIAVYCAGKDFKGEGHVDVAIPDGELKDYLLRIAGMVNIALAASNIPDNLSKEDVDKYRPIMGYIKNQYKAILGEELAIPDSPEDILKVIRRIVLGLPKSMRMNTDQIEEFNKLAKQAITAA